MSASSLQRWVTVPRCQTWTGGIASHPMSLPPRCQLVRPITPDLVVFVSCCPLVGVGLGGAVFSRSYGTLLLCWSSWAYLVSTTCCTLILRDQRDLSSRGGASVASLLRADSSTLKHTKVCVAKMTPEDYTCPTPLSFPVPRAQNDLLQ